MSFLTNLVAPYLPVTAQDYLRAVDPLLSLLSNPAGLVWTAYSNPQRILQTLGQTGNNLYTVSRDLDIGAIYSDVEHRFREGSIQGLAPLLVGAFAIFLTFRTLMGTFRSGFRLFGTLVRYGSFISLLIAAVGWFTGGQQGNQGGLANVLGGLAGGNNNANGGGGMANGLFNMAKNYATGANGQQQGAGNGVWDQAQGLFANVMEGQQQQQAKTGAKYNTRSAKQRSAAAGSANAGSNRASAPAAGDENLSDIAQGWVKDALLKATGLDSFFGGDATKQKANGKKDGRAGADGRRAGSR